MERPVPTLAAPAAWSVPQRAAVRIRAGRRVGLRASVEVTPAGLVAIGGLVSSILLSTAVIVHVAMRARPPCRPALPPEAPLR